MPLKECAHICVWLPQAMKERLDWLCEHGYIMTVSEGVRQAVYDYLVKMEVVAK